MANSSETQLAYIAETTYGTTPSTPTWQKQRFVSESLVPSLNYATSNEIRLDRNIPDITKVASEAAGDVNFELSYGTFDEWLESVMFAAWDTDVLINGNTEKSFTLEKYLIDDDGNDQYHRFTGAVANTLSLSIAANSQVEGTFGFIANGMTTAQAEVTSSTYDEPNDNPIIESANDFASLSVTGATGITLTALELNITNNLRQQQALGEVNPVGIGTGRFEVTGTMNAYFKDEALFDLYLDETAADLTFKLGGASEKNYLFEMNNVKFSNGSIVAGGNDEELLAQMEFTALYNSTDGGSLKITRTGAA